MGGVALSTVRLAHLCHLGTAHAVVAELGNNVPAAPLAYGERLSPLVLDRLRFRADAEVPGHGLYDDSAARSRGAGG
jgi:hypothetical protein